MRLVLLIAAIVLAVTPDTGAGEAQESGEYWLHAQWNAHWIAPHGVPSNDYGVFLFRKKLELPVRPGRFVVHVSADARYRLFVNGVSVSVGPQRSDKWVWRYDSIDLAPWLVQGANVIAAQVWSYGDLTPTAVVGERTSFLLQGDTVAEEIANTDHTWLVTRDDGRKPLPFRLPTYIVVGPGEQFDASGHPWGWQKTGFDDSSWSEATSLARGNPYGRGADMDHWLSPRTIAAVEESPVRFEAVRRGDGVFVPAGFLAGSDPLEIPAHTKVAMLLDNGVETNAYPQLTTSGGKGSRIRMTYAEALTDTKRRKGNRDEVEGREIAGIADEFLPDGGEKRLFSTLLFRTYRYVQLDIETGDTPLRIDGIRGEFTGYPLEVNGTFVSDDPALARIWDVGWRTARLCAFETYVDCPYYEQLQYVGDTRIQALISLYVSGDDRLMRNAIELYDRSRIAEGLTQSRYPSVVPQVINTFSLFWIDMVHDYWMHRPDDAFVRSHMAGVEAVIEWFDRRVDPSTGLLGPLDYWTFVDWTSEWPWDPARGVGGEPPGAQSGGSSIVSFQLAKTLLEAAELERAFGDRSKSHLYERRAKALLRAAQKLCWDRGRGLYTDTPEKKSFSQHANTFAVLAGAVHGRAATDLMSRVLTDGSIVQSSTYFRFYVLRAMKKAGLGDQYLDQLGPWKTMLDRGLTTFAEKMDPTRSDCHAWSASPVYEFLATVAGVEPDSPGFRTIRIEPHLGNLQHVEAVIPHPDGDVRVTLERKGEGLGGQVSLPKGVQGVFIWNGRSLRLHEGGQTIAFRR